MTCSQGVPYVSRRFAGLAAWLALAGLFVTTQPARAQDGRTILLKTMQFYGALHSYGGQANTDTMMLNAGGKLVKQVGASSVMKMVRPNKIYLFLQNPAGSRAIYSDGKSFSVYEATPDRYITTPTNGTPNDLMKLLATEGGIEAGYDPLFFLTHASLPKTLTAIQYKGESNWNGHPVYVVTGAINASPAGGAAAPLSYCTWWIDRSSYLLYRVETTTPHVVKQVSFGAAPHTVIKSVKGTLVVRYTVSGIKMDPNYAPSDFVFTPPKTAMRRRTIEELLKAGGK